MKYWIYILLAFLMFGACTQTQNLHLTEEEEAAIKKEVQVFLEQYSAAVKKRGLKAEFDFIGEPENFRWQPPGYKVFIKYDSVATLINQNAARYKLVNNRYEVKEILVPGSGTATYNAKVYSHMEDNEGQSTDVVFSEVGVLKKKRDGWKLMVGVTTIIK